MENTNDKYTVIFRAPYKFEGTEESSVSLAGIETLTAQDIFAAESYAAKMRRDASAGFVETTAPYLLFLAARAAGKPIEYMEGLPSREAIVVKYAVTSFLQ